MAGFPSRRVAPGRAGRRRGHCDLAPDRLGAGKRVDSSKKHGNGPRACLTYTDEKQLFGTLWASGRKSGGPPLGTDIPHRVLTLARRWNLGPSGTRSSRLACPERSRRCHRFWNDDYRHSASSPGELGPNNPWLPYRGTCDQAEERRGASLDVRSSEQCLDESPADTRIVCLEESTRRNIA